MDMRSIITVFAVLCFIFSTCRSLFLDFDDVPKVYSVRCNGTTPASGYNRPNESINYGLVEMIDCDTPSTVYLEVLQTLQLKMPRKLRIFLDEDADIRPNQFEGLQIKSLDVRYKASSIFKTEVLTNLTGLEELYLSSAYLQPLPPTMIKQLELWSGKSMGSIGHCEYLEKLTLVWWNVDAIPNTWLKNCTKLRILSLKQMPSRAVTTLLSGTNSITELYLFKCQLLVLSPEILTTQTGLRILHVDHNRIKNIIQYKHSPYLADVDLSYNELSDFDEVVHFLGKQKDVIVNFTIANNRVIDICQKDGIPNMYQFFLLENVGPMPNLKRLSLSGTSTTELCLHILKTPSLEYLDLSKNKLTALEFQHLPLATAKHLKEINLKNTQIKTVDLDKTNFDMLMENGNELKLSGLTVTLDCDCANAWLARAVRSNLIIINAYCKNEKRLELAPIADLECDKFNCENCICRQEWQSGNVSAYCNGEQTRIPKQINLTTLVAPGNLVADFNVTDLTYDLVNLDLRKNHIAKLDANVVEALFSVSERRLNFSGNPLVCDCDNVPLLEALKNHRHQVEDYENITCVDDGRGLDDLDFEELCAKPLDPRIMIVSSFLLGLCAILAVSTALFLKYERQIKVFLYARGCCLWWIREDELDADRPFDAFISFAHEDDDFVMGTLMMELEQCGYRLCVHYRDWLPGEWIPTQITRSVELSRRTIIVLSKSFLESVWGLLEFRLAHVCTLKEGRPRIIALMLEDIEDKQMDDELRGYLKSNTYVKWGERWFWDKLKYALPHRVIDGSIEMQNVGHPMA